MSTKHVSFSTPLVQIGRQVPLGFECRSCGASAYNWIMKIDRYIETGESCCADWRDWCEKADAARAPQSSASARGPVKP